MTTEIQNIEEICAALRSTLKTARTRRELLSGLAALTATGLVAPRQAAFADETARHGVHLRRRVEARVHGVRSPHLSPSRPAFRCGPRSPTHLAKLRAMHEAKAQQIDVVSMGGPDAIMANRLKMAAPIDWTLIDRSQLSEKQLARPNCIGGYSLTEVICYNNKHWSAADAPQSWADFWNVEKFPGRRALRRDAIWSIEAALLADGVRRTFSIRSTSTARSVASTASSLT